MAKKRISRPLRKLIREADKSYDAIPDDEHLKSASFDYGSEDGGSLTQNIIMFVFLVNKCVEEKGYIEECKTEADLARNTFEQWVLEHQELKHTGNCIMAWIKVYDYFLECEGLK